jgi:hypothetical protein
MAKTKTVRRRRVSPDAKLREDVACLQAWVADQGYELGKNLIGRADADARCLATAHALSDVSKRLDREIEERRGHRKLDQIAHESWRRALTDSISGLKDRGFFGRLKWLVFGR